MIKLNMILTVLTDAGRSISRYKDEDFDCTVIASAVAFDVSYNQAHQVLSQCGRKKRKGTTHNETVKAFHQLADKYNKKIVQYSFPTQKGEKRMNIEKFLKLYRKGTFILKIPGEGRNNHIMVVKDQQIYDSYAGIHYLKLPVYKAYKVI